MFHSFVFISVRTSETTTAFYSAGEEKLCDPFYKNSQWTNIIVINCNWTKYIAPAITWRGLDTELSFSHVTGALLVYSLIEMRLCHYLTHTVNIQILSLHFFSWTAQCSCTSVTSVWQVQAAECTELRYFYTRSRSVWIWAIFLLMYWNRKLVILAEEQNWHDRSSSLWITGCLCGVTPAGRMTVASSLFGVLVTCSVTLRLNSVLPCF